jgi:hypothetical protein
MAILINDVSATGPLEQGIDYTISSDGPFWVRTWIGAASQIAVLVPVAAINAESIQFRNEAPKAILTARYARHPITGAESVQNHIEIKSEIETASLFVVPAYAGIPKSVKQIIQKVFDEQLPVRDFTDSTANPPVTTPGVVSVITQACKQAPDVNDPGTPCDPALSLELYSLMVGGTLHFEVYSTSLTFTRIVSRYFSTKLSRDDIGQLFSTAQVAAYIGDPILFDVPSLTITDAETALGFVPSWRKRLADINAIAGGSRTMVENWSLNKWNKKIYPPAAGSGL